MAGPGFLSLSTRSGGDGTFQRLSGQFGAMNGCQELASSISKITPAMPSGMRDV
jgi:hypothetical protein